MFNEITTRGIKKAFEKPGQVNIHLVEAQQARRVLDRLVGYKISPLLWDKVRRGLSAGRVQTVAVRADCGARARDPRVREERILDDRRQPGGEEAAGVRCPAVQAGGRRRMPAETPEIGSQAAADAIVRLSKGAEYVVKSVGTREKRRNPVAPFITSTLQQESSRKLRFSVKRTMMLAQRLV